MLKESELTQTPAKKNKKGPPMINFKGKKYAISEDTAISWLKSVHFQLAKPLAEKMGLELPEDFVSDNEYLEAGVWSIEIVGRKVIDGRVDISYIAL